MEKEEAGKELILEEVISKSVQIPGVKVVRSSFLAQEFATITDNVQEVIELGPIGANIPREEINKIANKLILKRTSQSSMASFAAGIPGGFAMAATIPADVMQFFGMALRLAQELSYLYGAEDIWKDGKVDSQKVQNQLILYCGAMFGVSGAISGVRVLSTQLAKTALKKLPQQALTKTFWYPILKKIMSQLGVKITKNTVAKGASKIIPVLGGVISGSINFASMMPMAKRLNEALDKAAFDYSEEEFEEDIIEISKVEEFEEEKEETKSIDKIKDKFSEGLNITKTNMSNFVGKFKENKEKNIEKEDPYEEVKKLKELMDMDIITKEEFDKKKKQLLGL